MADNKKAILVVSFGTSYEKTREETIGAIEQSIAGAFPEWEVRRAFTSGFIIRKILREQGIAVDTVEEALERAAEDGIRHLVVQPTHMMSGGEYEKLTGQCLQMKSRFQTFCNGLPLLTGQADFDELIRALESATAEYNDGKTAVCFMGHGTTAESNAVYTQLQKQLREKGYEHLYIGTVEAEPALEDLLAAVRKCPAYERVVLQPLMVVAGDHAVNDMAGDGAESWKSVFSAAGYEVICVLEGLGQNQDVQQMYVRHVREAMASMEGGLR